MTMVALADANGSQDEEPEPRVGEAAVQNGANTGSAAMEGGHKTGGECCGAKCTGL